MKVINVYRFICKSILEVKMSTFFGPAFCLNSRYVHSKDRA